MKPKKSLADFNMTKTSALILFAVASLLYLNGCTAKALQLAKEKASPQNVEYRKIKRVVSGGKQKNGDISVCVELIEPVDAGEQRLSTLTLPRSILTGDYNDVKRLKLLPVECRFSNTLCYWYPVEQVKSGCDKIAAGDLLTLHILPIEKLPVESNIRDQLNDSVNAYNDNQQIPEKLYEARDVFNGVSVIYWPGRIEQHGSRPISIAGIYEDKSTNLYYLAVPAAFVGDVIIVVTVIAVVVAGVALGTYMQLQ